MSDPVFSGRDEAEAVAAAEQALGIPPGQLRYVLLHPGAPGGRGLSAEAARIAVVMASRPASREVARAAAESADPRAGIRALVRTLADAAAVDLTAELAETDDTLTVRLAGPGHRMLLEDEGDVLRAFEYLLQLMFRRALEPRRLVVECEGYRAQRDEGLQAEARRLAEAVLADGAARTTAVLNSYERRLVHVALSEHPGVETFSVGTEGSRRVTIAVRGTRGGPTHE